MTSASIARGEKETQSKEQWSGAVGVRREPAVLREGNRLGRVPGRYRACERRDPTVRVCLGLHLTVWRARPPACTLPLPPHVHEGPAKLPDPRPRPQITSCTLVVGAADRAPSPAVASVL